MLEACLGENGAQGTPGKWSPRNPKAPKMEPKGAKINPRGLQNEMKTTQRMVPISKNTTQESTVAGVGVASGYLGCSLVG